MILLVHLEVIRQIADSFTQKGYLNLRRTGVSRVQFEVFDDFLFPARGHCHGLSSFVSWQ
jgi:hypothetical protein